MNISGYLEKVSGFFLAPNKPITGQNAFSHKSGVHTNGILKDPRTYEHIQPDSVGNVRRVLVSDQAGKSNILAELERRAALPWWRQSFAHWPAAMRSVFLVISAAAAAILIGGLFLVTRSPETAQVAGAVSERFGWLLVLRSMVDGAQGTAGVVFRAIPPLWLYGSLAFLGVCYATVIGVGAAAYRFYSARP